jgi:sarcosine oxidase gamma subunit
VKVGEQWRLETIRVVDCFEWHAPTACWANDVGPGYALTQGDKRLLHFAPRFLLTINQGAAAPPVATAAEAIGINVTGKWCGYRLHGSSSPAVLAAGVPSGTVLAGRNCAALSLFDCPVVLLRTPDSSEVWVPASYAESLGSALNKTAQRVKPAGQ